MLGAPVVTPEGRVAGIVLQSDAREALSERTQSSFLRGQGILGGEELRSMPYLPRTLRRLAWLTLNIGLNLVAASVIARNEHVIEAAIALAFFIPIISDMSGSAGTQAAAVSLRELALGLATPGEIMRVIWKETAAGLLLGVATGAMLAVVTLVYKGSPWLGLAVGVALTFNTVLATMVGGCLPLLLKRWKLDPGAASGVIQTTVTDMTGFFIVLKLAEMVLHRL